MSSRVSYLETWHNYKEGKLRRSHAIPPSLYSRFYFAVDHIAKLDCCTIKSMKDSSKNNLIRETSLSTDNTSSGNALAV